MKLVVMRLADMWRVHPKQITDACDLCGTAVGIYPSGQLVIAGRGRENIEVVCHICHGPPTGPVRLAPGAESEDEQSVPAKKGE